MRHLWISILLLTLLLSACASSQPDQSASTGTPVFSASKCGNGVCENDEDPVSCFQDCAGEFSGLVATTTIQSGDSTIAVMVAAPQVQRYTDGAGVVVVVSPIFSETEGFLTDPDLTALGLIQVSYLWLGETASGMGMRSEGEFDYGGERSTEVLRDVIRFAAGRMADSNGRYIVSMTTVPPLTDEIGVYAFGDAGIVAVNALSLYGDQFQGLQYYVGNENPTVDTLACLEIGYYDRAGQPVLNPFYQYPATYSFAQLTLNFTNLRWDPAYTDSTSQLAGRPYLDLDGDSSISTGDFIFSGDIPTMFGKRYYSTALTQALLDNTALSADSWPSDLATPEEAAQAWTFRQSPSRFAAMQESNIIQDLKVMLVFGRDDHAQVALDKPHVHQAFQGFRFEAKLWVRLEPDWVYVQSLMPSANNSDFSDNPANTQPADWMEIGQYAYPVLGQTRRLVPLAAVAEMADRAHAGRWDENLGQVVYLYPPATLQP